MQADRHLLFGLLALQNNFLSRDQLVTAFGIWIADKQRPLSDILVQQGALSSSVAELLVRLTDQHIEQHSDDIQNCLRSLSSASSACTALAALEDRELQASVSQVLESPDSDPFSTRLSLTTDSGQRFEFRRPLGRGGLGVVSIALDRELNREVALKEIRADRAHEDSMRRRFVTEAEVTGNLEHPGIVPVYALGMHDDGRPYYAMRFVRGDNLTLHIKEFHERVQQGQVDYDGSVLRELLRRYLDVCDAVGYAHSRGVLHRDLKPGNIMLGKFGETLVVDWGLAKAQGRSGDSAAAQEPILPKLADSEQTGMGSFVGTLAYAPPEQIDGHLEQIDARSDVYGLGAILYELLTGTNPVNGIDPNDVASSIRRGAIPSPKVRQAKVPLGLDRICMKAMAPNRADRYASAQQLMQDVAAWLDDEPIAVCPDGWVDRLRRRFRKHKQATVTAFAALAVVSIILATSLAVVNQARRAADAARQVAVSETRRANEQYQNAERQRERGDLYFRQAREAVDRFLTTVSDDSLLNQPAFLPLRRTLLSASQDYYQQFRDRSEGDSQLALEQFVETNRKLASIQLALGEPEQSLQSIQRALDVDQRATSSPASETRNAPLRPGRQELILQKASTILRLGKHAEARQLIQPLFELAKEPLGQDLPTLEVAAGCCSLIGAISHTQLDRATALSAFQREIDLRKEILNLNPNASSTIKHALAIINLAGSFSETRQFPEAIALYQQAQELLENVADTSKPTPDSTSIGEPAQTLLSNVHHQLAICFRATGDKGQAAHHYDTVIRLRQDRVTQSLVPGPTEDLAKSLADVSDFWQVNKELGKAKDAAAQAVNLSEALVQRFVGTPDYQVLLAESLVRHAMLLEDKEPALVELRRAEQLFRQVIENKSVRQNVRLMLGECLKSVARIYRTHGDAEATFAAMDRACEYCDEVALMFPDDYQIQLMAAGTANLNGTFLIEKKQFQRAIVPLSKAVDRYLAMMTTFPDSPLSRTRLVISRVYLAQCLLAEKKLAECRQQITPLLTQLAQFTPPLPPEIRQLYPQAIAINSDLLLAEGQPLEAAIASEQRLALAPKNSQIILAVCQTTARCAALTQGESEERRKLLDLFLKQLELLRESGFKDVAKLRAIPEVEVLAKDAKVEQVLKDMERPN